MEHIAIDLGGKKSQICVRSADGKIIDEVRCKTADLDGYLVRRPPGRVIVESSAEAFAVADIALKRGHEARVVHSKLAPMLGVGEHGVKNDQRDARAVSKASCVMDLQSVHIPSAQSRERKAMCGMRDALIQARTQLINCTRGYLRTQLMLLPKGTPKTFPQRVRDALLARPQGLPSFVERNLDAVEALTTQIDLANRELKEIAQNDQRCRRAMTVPGVGPITALRFVATVDTIERFRGGHTVESYLGLTPREDSSGERQRRGSITKAGSTAFRWTLTQACWSAWRTKPNDPMVVWAKQVAVRRGKRIAIIALARKMTGILYALWRDQTAYDPNYAVKNKDGFEDNGMST